MLWAQCPEERSEAKEVENYRYTSVPMVIRLKLFRTIISVNQFSIYGTVADLCEEDSSCQAKKQRLVVAKQSHLLLIMTSRPSIEIPTQENFLPKYKERVERIPQQDQLIKISTDAGFLKTVEVGQYFMTKYTEEFLTIYRIIDLSRVHFAKR